MKIQTPSLRFWLAQSLSLALVACANLPQQPQTLAPQNAGPQAQNTVAQNQPKQTENLRITLPLPAAQKPAFNTQFADYSHLAFVKVSVSGQGISSPLSNDGGDFIAVSGKSFSATISNVPQQNGGVRVVTAWGYDADHKLLPSFEAMGVYTSQTGTTTVNLTLGRRWLLLGQIVDNLISNNPTLLAKEDLNALQTALEEMQGYNSQTGGFVYQPTLFNIQNLVNALSGDGSIPSSSALMSAGMVTAGPATGTVQTPNGHKTDEDVTLLVNDPGSKPQLLPGGSVVVHSLYRASIRALGAWKPASKMAPC